MSVSVAQPLRPVVFVGESMSPTYPYGSVALTVPYRGHLRKGDVVVLRSGTARVIKRVAFLGGDRVPQVKVYGNWVDGTNFRLTQYRLKHRDLYREIPVPKGHLYLLGDNVSLSVDSRQLGLFHEADVERIIVSPKARANSPFHNAYLGLRPS